MAREVLVTGATGTLGHRVVGEATEAGHHVRALSRKSHVGYTGVHWAQGDLLSGEGIDAALAFRAESGLDPASVERVTYGTSRSGMTLIGDDLARRQNPQNVVDGQFSGPFVIAAALEAFWSSARWVPGPVKVGVGAACWVAVIGYFLFQGRSVRGSRAP